MKITNAVLNYKDLKIFQDTEQFSYSLDSVLLARFYNPKKADQRICDFGTNNAIIPLILSKYINKDTRIIGVEINKTAFELAVENVELNNLSEQVRIVNQDIKEYIKGKNNYFDVVYSNPPFFKVNEGSNLNLKKEELVGARHEVFITLNEIIKCAKIALKNGGKFIMIHLAERLDEIVYLLKKHNFTIKQLQIIYSKAGQEGKKVLIKAENDGNWGVKILPPLVVHNDDGSYSKEVEVFFGD